MIFVLFTAQLLIPDPRFRYYFSYLYIVLTIGLIIVKRDNRESVLGFFQRDSSPQAAPKE